MNKEIGIYKITNLINNKVYIGRSIHIEQRWKEHCRPSAHSIIGTAIKAYGQDNFNFEVIEECSPWDLEAKEKRWIEFYNCFIPNGYNVLDETKNNVTHYGFIEKDKVLEIIDELQKNEISSLSNIAKKYNINVSTVSRLNKGEIHQQDNLSYPLRNVSFNYGKEKQKQPRISKLSDKDINIELAKKILSTSFQQVAREYGYKRGSSLQNRLKEYGFPHTVEELKKYCEKVDVPELV